MHTIDNIATNRVAAMCKILVQDFNDLSRYVIRRDIDTIAIDTRFIAKQMIENGSVDGDLDTIDSMVGEALRDLSSGPPLHTRAEFMITKSKSRPRKQRYTTLIISTSDGKCYINKEA